MGRFTDQGGLFSYISPDKRVPANHPLRKVRELPRCLNDLNRSLGRLYASEGRPSIPPEQLLSALLLQVSPASGSERQLMEQLDYNLLYRWFVGLSPDDPVWDPTASHQEPGAAAERRCVHEVHDQASEPSAGQTAVGRALLGGWNADGKLGFAEAAFAPRTAAATTMMALTSMAQKRKNDTHASTSDPDSRLYRKAARTGGQALLYGSRHHGEPAWAGGGRQGHACQWHRRTPGFKTMLKARRKAAGRSSPPVRTRRTIPPVVSP